MRWLAGRRPDHLGAPDGRLAPLGSRPNGVSSQEDGPCRVEPLPFVGSLAETRQRLLRLLRELPGVEVVSADERYLHAEASSRLLGFVDDLELCLDEDSRTVHLRSQARLGYSDGGVNRRRVESLRQLWESRA